MSARSAEGRRAVVVETVRTPIGRAQKGSLAAERPDDLLAFAFAQLLARVPELDPAEIDDVIAGCGYPTGQQGKNVARRAALLAGLPISVPGVTVSRFCASSLHAVREASHAVAAGEGRAFLVGGVESISRTDRGGGEDESHPALSGEREGLPDVYISMGLTAENVARRYGVGRAEMDRYAQRSQELAVAAQDSGFFAREIAPYTTAAGTLVGHDDGPRRGSTLEGLAALKPAFAEDGVVTAGNACPLNDGAAAALIMEEGFARSIGARPKARILATSAAALEPEYMGMGPVPAIESVLGRARMTLGDVGLVEINEAFAVQVIAVGEQLGIDPFDERLNPHGGAIAVGHPFGMTGVRILGTLLNGMAEREAEIGLESMCVAQGQGMAMLVERLG